MKYRLTCLTPVLVGDGRKLSAIDYMVWRDQVSVLDQQRIFKLLSRGPRLEGYLAQLKRADKLDFASWGGFAQNYAGRRIPFENPVYSQFWNRAMGDSLNIPTFAAGPSGPYMPGAAIKGALKTGYLFSRFSEGTLHEIAERSKADRPPRRPAEIAEERAAGGRGSDRVRGLAVGDSAPVNPSIFKIFLLRTASLQQRGPAYSLAWKQAGRGSVDGARPDDSTPVFAEMAPAGSAFEGDWQERKYLAQPGRPEPLSREQAFEAANRYALALLAVHKQYAAWANLTALAAQLTDLENRAAAAQQSGACLLSLGWGAGVAGKSAWIDTANPDYRQILQSLSLYGNALRSGMPFPKTRRVVFLDNKPASLPGWALLEVAG